MKPLTLKGCGTALFTPFKDGKVDEAAFAATVRRQVEAGIHFLVPLGTTGETPCLSVAERQRVLALARENAPGKTLLVGGGTNSLTATLESMAQLPDADAYLIVVPYYNKPNQTGLYEYYKAVAGSTDKPIVIYNVPGRTGANITAETTLRLAEEVPNIVAVKEASSNYKQISEIIRCKPAGFSVLSGNDDETLSLMATGADGVAWSPSPPTSPRAKWLRSWRPCRKTTWSRPAPITTCCRPCSRPVSWSRTPSPASMPWPAWA